jgi:hypothetical protein
LSLVVVFGEVFIFVAFFVVVIAHVFEFSDGFSGAESAEEFTGEGFRAQVFGVGHEGLGCEGAVLGVVDDLVYILFLFVARFVVA